MTITLRSKYCGARAADTYFRFELQPNGDWHVITDLGRYMCAKRGGHTGEHHMPFRDRRIRYQTGWQRQWDRIKKSNERRANRNLAKFCAWLETMRPKR